MSLAWQNLSGPLGVIVATVVFSWKYLKTQWVRSGRYSNHIRGKTHFNWAFFSCFANIPQKLLLWAVKTLPSTSCSFHSRLRRARITPDVLDNPYHLWGETLRDFDEICVLWRGNSHSVWEKITLTVVHEIIQRRPRNPFLVFTNALFRENVYRIVFAQKADGLFCCEHVNK
jgi:hypothetical protein